MKLFNKDTPLEKGVKISYRTYIILSCLSTAAMMILMGLSYSYSLNSSEHVYLLYSVSGLVLICSTVMNQYKSKELFEKRDELAYFNQLKTIQVLAYLAIGGLTLFMFLNFLKVIFLIPFMWYFYLIAIVSLLYAVVFYFFDKKGA